MGKIGNIVVMIMSIIISITYSQRKNWKLQSTLQKHKDYGIWWCPKNLKNKKEDVLTFILNDSLTLNIYFQRDYNNNMI